MACSSCQSFDKVCSIAGQISSEAGHCFAQSQSCSAPVQNSIASAPQREHHSAGQHTDTFPDHTEETLYDHSLRTAQLAGLVTIKQCQQCVSCSTWFTGQHEAQTHLVTTAAAAWIVFIRIRSCSIHLPGEGQALI